MQGFRWQMQLLYRVVYTSNNVIWPLLMDSDEKEATKGGTSWRTNDRAGDLPNGRTLRAQDAGDHNQC